MAPLQRDFDRILMRASRREKGGMQNTFASPRLCVKNMPMSIHKKSPVSRSGRFAGGPAADVAQFTESISFDWRLWKHDILGSLAHAAMLKKIGVLTQAEEVAIIRGLDQIAREIKAGQFKWKPELEDVHMNIEAELTKRVPAGAKLHTARSRNDQVALDVRLWLRDEITALLGEIAGLQRALVGLGEKNSTVIIPGYTHLQRAQPVYFAHHLLAYVEMLERDCERLWDCHSRVNICPLGSGAIAGSTLKLDRAFVAKTLDFVDASGRVQLTQNSMDAVSDRDFAVEFCAAGALIAMHLSRLAEDVILWASAEFNFIKIADAYTTGSSLMPQKKNPDIAELSRGKTGRVFGNLMSLLTLLKGLPMTYNRDLQEDKERLFDTADTVRATTRLMAAMLSNTKINAATCAAAASDPALLATDLADYLVRQGMAFRPAHHVVGAVVALAEKTGKPLNQLTLAELQSVDKTFGRDALGVFNLQTAMAKRNLTGAPGTKEVAKQLARWRERLS
ncbi:MAG TPA: argininosuccinate lyase [Verrucomicrobiae bacterium]|jgi:argininosuccinate lyase